MNRLAYSIGTGLVVTSLGISTSIDAQDLSCNLQGSNLSVTTQLETVQGEVISLSDFTGGLQTIILGNRSTSTQSREAAQRLGLEFNRYNGFRRVIVIDGTKVARFENLVMESLQSSAISSDAPLLAADFEGDRIAPLRSVALEQIANWDDSEQAILFILDGSGQVLGLQTLDQPLLPSQVCLRQQVRDLNLRTL